MFSQVFLIFLTSFVPDPPVGTTKVEKKINLEQGVADISGYYTCKGTDGGKPYNGVAVVMKKNNIYVVQWVVGGGNSFTGIGIRQGNVLSVSWALPGEKTPIRGINMYRIEPGPRLTGRWATLPGNGVLQSETLTFLKVLEEEKE